jgi:hypothetical protein
VGDFNGSTQVHDFEPGITASGLFWTIPISDDAFRAKPGIGRARFQARHLAVADYHDFLNAVGLNPTPISSVLSHVSFDVRWDGGGNSTKVHDSTFGFEGRFVDGPVSIQFTAAQDGSDVSYRSDPANQITVSGGVGHERNGIFFR